LRDQVTASAAVHERWAVGTAQTLERSNTATAEALEKSTNAAMMVLEKRLDLMNEFRGAMADQAGSYFTRIEHEAYQKAVESDLRVLRESKAELAGKASQASVNITFVLAMIGSLAGVVALVLEVLRG